MRTEYIIDRYQETYFVIDSFDQMQGGELYVPIHPARQGEGAA